RLSYQPQSRMADRRSHSADLTVAPLYDCDLEPRGRNALSFSNRRHSRPDIRRLDHSNFRWTSRPVIEPNAVGEISDRLRSRNSFHLYPICFRQLVSRIRYQVLEPSRIGKQNQSFAVVIQAARRVDVLYRNIIG